MSNSNKCVVLNSLSGYSDEYLALLEGLLEEEIELFCAVGKECEKWEEAMDQLCVYLDISGKKSGAFCTTTSHPNEILEEVVQFAQDWNAHESKVCDVKVIEI